MPVFTQDPVAKVAAENTAFDTALPPFLAHVEGLLRDSGSLVGENLTTADFWIGGLYTNFFKNPLRYSPERWDALLVNYPKFAAYGERFSQANQAWLNNPARGQAPC